jgi:hypothetical protein
MLDADDATHRQVMQLASEPGTGFLGHDRVDELLVVAALTILAGRRKPRRWRTRSSEALSQFWGEVGEHRDRRVGRDPMDDLAQIFDED